MKKLKIPKYLKKKSKKFGILIIFLVIIVNFTSLANLFLKNNAPKTNVNPKMSWFWATLDLTNPIEVNNSMFTHYASITIKGRLYNKINESIDTSGVNVAIEINDIIDYEYTNITGINGYFTIRYTINPYLDVYSSHKLEVIVTDTEPGGPGSEIEYHHFYVIYVNATSFFNIISHDDISTPKLTEEDFNLNGYLYFDNGDGISFESVNYYWLDGTSIVSQGSFFTDGSGSLTNLQVPITSASYLTLKFNYSDFPYVDYSETSLLNIKVFSGVTWNLDIDYTTREGATYTLTGILSSSTNPSLRISNRDID
jgi:hypothetical protein